MISWGILPLTFLQQKVAAAPEYRAAICSLCSMRVTTLLSVLLTTLFATVGVAHADWDRKGWVKLGEREVNGKIDRDRIEVGAIDGRFTKLTMFVEKSEIEMLDFEVTFGDGEKFHPEVRYYFKEGSRTREIALPGNPRIIKAINLKYKNVGRGGRARVEVWGFRVATAPPEPVWNRRDWVKLGEREVNGKLDRDRIEVGAVEGRFTKLTLFVEKSEIELLDFEVTFGDGERFHPPLNHYFKEGSRTRAIDLPGNPRIIKAINLKYKNVPGGGRARVEVWGFKTGGNRR